MRLTLPVTFALMMVVLTLGFFPIADPDFFWHVKIGELINLSGEIPTIEVFSHSAAGQPWLIQGWLADRLLELVWRLAGLTGIRALVAVLLVLTWWFVYRAARLYVQREETALLLSALAVALITPALAPRPTMLTALALAITVYALLGFRRTGRLRWLFIVPPLFALWSNLHFGFVTGLGIWALFLVSDVFSKLKPFRLEFREKGSLLSKWPILIGALTVLAIGLNPIGYDIFWTIFVKFLDDSSSPISEWQTPSFSSLPGKMVYAAMCTYVVARSLASRAISWVDLLVPLAVIGAALSAQRNVPLMGIVLVPFIARALSSIEPNLFGVSLHSSVQPIAKAARRDLGPRVSTIVNAGLLLCTLAAVALTAPVVERHFAEGQLERQPVGAADFILTHKLQGNLFNTYNGGGYLVYRLYPAQRVFIDGRYNPYPKRVMDDYFSISKGEPGWFEKLRSYGIDIVLCENRGAFRQLMLLRSEFRLVYVDDKYSVLVRDIDSYSGLETVPDLQVAGARK